MLNNVLNNKKKRSLTVYFIAKRNIILRMKRVGIQRMDVHTIELICKKIKNNSSDFNYYKQFNSK